MCDYEHRKTQAMRLILTGRATDSLQDAAHNSAPDECLEPTIAQSRVGRLQTELLRCLRALKMEFPYNQLAQTFHSAHRAHSGSALPKPHNNEKAEVQICSKVNELLTQWFEQFNTILTHALVTELTAATKAGFTDLFTAWTERCRLHVSPISYTKGLRDWVTAHVDQVVDSMNNTIRETINQVVTNGLTLKLSADDILEDVRNKLEEQQPTDQWLSYIAASECRTAANHGALEAALALGAQLKRWQTDPRSRRCAACIANEAQGNIPINQPFLSGDSIPCAHPNCRCHLEFPGLSCKVIARALD